jgi:hypothetical protein
MGEVLRRLGAPHRRRQTEAATTAADDAYSASRGSVIHLLRGWAADMPAAVVVGSLHPPYYVYRSGRCELVEPPPPRR